MSEHHTQTRQQGGLAADSALVVVRAALYNGGPMEPQYQVLERIAVGGMAEIYYGTARAGTEFERPVVIKRVHRRYSQDKRFVEMLIREAKITARLNHDNIVQVLDLGQSDDGQYFLVMEYVKGHDLRAIIDTALHRSEPLPLSSKLHILAEVSDALGYAHRLSDEQGRPLELIHRDVSPSNVLISYSGEVKLTDFGVARFGRDVSLAGSLKGKIAYMSPEQARGESFDHRSDIFSLGAIAFELLLDRRLFTAMTDIQMLHQVRRAEIPLPSTVEPAIDTRLERILLRALAPLPADRFQSAEDLGSALRDFAFRSDLSPTGGEELSRLLFQLFGPPPDRGDSATESSQFSINRVEPAGSRAPGTSSAQRPLRRGDRRRARSGRPEESVFEQATARRFVDQATRVGSPSETLLGESRRPVGEPAGAAVAARSAPRALDAEVTRPGLTSSEQMALLRVLTGIPDVGDAEAAKLAGLAPVGSEVEAEDQTTTHYATSSAAPLPMPDTDPMAAGSGDTDDDRTVPHVYAASAGMDVGTTSTSTPVDVGATASAGGIEDTKTSASIALDDDQLEQMLVDSDEPPAGASAVTADQPARDDSVPTIIKQSQPAATRPKPPDLVPLPRAPTTVKRPAAVDVQRRVVSPSGAWRLPDFGSALDHDPMAADHDERSEPILLTKPARVAAAPTSPKAPDVETRRGRDASSVVALPEDAVPLPFDREEAAPPAPVAPVAARAAPAAGKAAARERRDRGGGWLWLLVALIILAAGAAVIYKVAQSSWTSEAASAPSEDE